jgi:hypothetical protein
MVARRQVFPWVKGRVRFIVDTIGLVATVVLVVGAIVSYANGEYQKATFIMVFLVWVALLERNNRT